MSTISAGTTLTTALVQTGDTTGELVIKTDNGNTTAATFTTGGNLTFGATGARIQGDFSNSTLANRLMFQTSTSNSNSILSVIPNGTATTTAFQAFNNSDPTNASQADLRVSGSTDVRLSSTSAGSGTYLPLTFYTNGSERMRIDTSGNVGIGTSSPLAAAGLTVSKSADVGRIAIERTSTYTGTDIAGSLLFYYSGDSLASVNAVRDGADDAATLTFGTQPAGGSVTERMRIDSSGNLGIGTSSPTSGNRLVVADSDVQVELKATSNSGFINFDGTSLQFATDRNLKTGAFSDATKSAAQLVLRGTVSGSDMLFYTTASVNTTPTERMRITANGGISFGSSGTAYGSSGQLLQSNGDAAPTWVTVSTSPVVSAYAVGAYSTMQISGGSRSAGTQIAGSSCNAISHISNQTNAFNPNWYQQGTQSGTWQCMTSTTGGNSFSIVLMQRIS